MQSPLNMLHKIHFRIMFFSSFGRARTVHGFPESKYDLERVRGGIPAIDAWAAAAALVRTGFDLDVVKMVVLTEPSSEATHHIF